MPANGINGNATDEFPPNAMTAAVSKWTSCVPVNTSVYGEKKLDCSDGKVLPRERMYALN